MRQIAIEGDLLKRVGGVLTQAPMFHGLSKEHIENMVPMARLLSFEPGEPLVRQGDPSEEVMVLLKGEAHVVVGDTTVGVLRPPDVVGEMGFLLEEPRTATVAAASVQVLAIAFSNVAFQAMFQRIPPVGLAIARALARRLAHTSKQVPLPPWPHDAPLPGDDVVGLLPLEFMQRHRVLPLAVRGQTLTLGFVDDPEPGVLQAARKLLPSLEVTPVSIRSGLFSDVLKTTSGLTGAAWGSPVPPEAEEFIPGALPPAMPMRSLAPPAMAARSLAPPPLAPAAAAPAGGAAAGGAHAGAAAAGGAHAGAAAAGGAHAGGGLAGAAAAPPDMAAALAMANVVRKASPRLDQLLRRVVGEGASDLHLSAGHKPRWRVDGEMKELADAAPLGPADVYELLVGAMDDRTRAAFADHDADFAYAIPGMARFRVNVFRDHHGVGAVLRQIPDKILTFEQLGLPPVVGTLCKIPKGLILVTGPTGSGKSTTLAAMIDALNKTRRDHVITLEDPIEFVHKSQKCLVNQREVGPHTKSFARALKAALREDPDIVLVGEMRDLETVSLALETANTGHLVFATLHTSTAVSTIDRIINLFTAEQQPQIRATLADVLRGVVAQTLLRKIGGGRVAALEVLVANPAIANLIREGKTHQMASTMSTGKALGMQLLNDELARLVAERKVDFDEAMAKAIDKPDLARRCGKEAPAAPGQGS